MPRVFEDCFVLRFFGGGQVSGVVAGMDGVWRRSMVSGVVAGFAPADGWPCRKTGYEPFDPHSVALHMRGARVSGA